MKELNISKGIAIIAVLMLHILFINTYTPYPWIRYFGFLVLIFFTVSGYEFSASKVSVRKDYHNYIVVPLVYMLKYYLIIAVLYSLIMIITGKLGLLDCAYATLCEIFTESLVKIIFHRGYPAISFKPVFSAFWLIRDYTIANLIMIPAVRLYKGGKFRKIATFTGLLILSAACYVLLPNLPFQLQTIPSFCVFMFMGYVVKTEKLYLKFLQLSKEKRLIIALSLFAICAILSSRLEMNHIALGRFAMNDASFICWLLGMLVCAASIIPCLYGARALASNEKLSSFFTTLGRGSADMNFVHMFFAMSLFQITGIQNGRCISEAISVTPGLFLQFLTAFVFSFAMSYLWIILYRKIISFRVKHRRKNTVKPVLHNT